MGAEAKRHNVVAWKQLRIKFPRFLLHEMSAIVCEPYVDARLRVYDETIIDGYTHLVHKDVRWNALVTFSLLLVWQLRQSIEIRFVSGFVEFGVVLENIK